MNSLHNKHRIQALDILRSIAISLVFMCHYYGYTNLETFGFLSHIGWTGVDLFFVLSGYLIGNQIFSALAAKKTFSLKTFYYRRLLRTLPDYLFVLWLYCTTPWLRELPTLPPLWKFFTFTLNFGLVISAFNHAWSLCVEEQFYLVLPLVALLVAYRRSINLGWFIILTVFFAGMILRPFLWSHYVVVAGDDFNSAYYMQIYYPTYCRLDPLLGGVAIALLKNFHKEIWEKLIRTGNLWFWLGALGCGICCVLFYNRYALLPTAFGYPLLAISLTSITLAALCPNSYLYRLRIPGATTLATWSYAIYLTHKQIIVIIHSEFIHWGLDNHGVVMVLLTIAMCWLVGGLIYTFLEKPFLDLRDQTTSQKSYEPINTAAITQQTSS